MFFLGQNIHTLYYIKIINYYRKRIIYYCTLLFFFVFFLAQKNGLNEKLL